MEETQLTPTAEQPPVCAGCGNPAILKEYPTKLCSECREKFIKFPVPKWLWLFAGAIGVIVLFSLFTLPKTIAISVALEKGKKAERQHRYITAQRELEKVVKKLPELVEGRGHLMIAAFYNGDFVTMGNMGEWLADKKIEDQALFAQLNTLVAEMANYSSDSLKQVSAHYDTLGINIPDAVLLWFVHRHPNDVAAEILYSYALMNDNDFKGSDSMSAIILQQDAVYIPALKIRSMAQREMGNYQESLRYCEQMLDINRESSFALGSKARTYLKMKKDKEALQLALQSVDMNPKDAYAITSLVMAYHFNNDIKNRDILIDRYKNDSAVAPALSFALDIISKKQKFRD